MVQKSKLPGAEPERDMPRVFIGIGANIGNCTGNVIRALRELRLLPGIKILQSSGLYKTEPVGYREQQDFINAVVELQTSFTPEALLSATQEIERKMGRNRGVHWGPRIIDLDILCMGNQIQSTELLTLPHREIANRRFVLVPFNELAADFRVPGYEKSVQQLLESTSDTSKVELYITSCQVLKKLNEV